MYDFQSSNSGMKSVQCQRTGSDVISEGILRQLALPKSFYQTNFKEPICQLLYESGPVISVLFRF